MITREQIKALNEEELGYLYLCFMNEWNNVGMKYPFQFNFIYSYRNVAVQPILTKYSNLLKDEYKNIVLDILNKLEENK